MKAPFFRVFNGDVDITSLIDSFSYEDTIKEDSLLKITVIYSNIADYQAGGLNIATGDYLRFYYGYLRGEQSEAHKARVTDIEHSYASNLRLTIRCLDLGTTMKKTSQNKVWENVTSVQIAQTIAKKYGLEFEYDQTKKVWENLPQGNRSDFDFIRYLANREKDGNYTFFIRNETLYFVERGLGSDSILSLNFGSPNSGIISFRTKYKTSTQPAAANNVVTTSIDPLKKKAEESIVSVKDKDKTTGEYAFLYNKNGEFVGSKEGVKEKLVTPETKEESKNIASSMKKQGTLKTLTATLTVEGNPLLVPNRILTIQNVLKEHAGNWYIESVNHSIKTSGYTTTLTLARNGYKAQTSVKNDPKDVNKSEGSTAVKDSKKIAVYDKDGSFIKWAGTNTPKKVRND